MGNCESYDTCINKERENLKHPIDHKSLYANRIVDNQTANRRCYETNPIEIIEGFGSKQQIMNVLKWVMIAIIVFVVISYVISYMSKETININVDKVNTEGLIDTETPEILKQLFKDAI